MSPHRTRPEKKPEPLLILTGEALDTIDGVHRDYTKKADHHAVVVLGAHEDRSTVLRRITEATGAVPLETHPLRRSRIEQLRSVQLLVYDLNALPKLEAMENATVITTDNINLPESIDLLRKKLDASPLHMKRGK